MTNDCKCGKPTDAYLCADCCDELARALGEVPWLADELEITATKAKGIDYRRLGGTQGGQKPTERPLPANWGASEARTHLRDLLRAWTKFCHDVNIRSTDTRNGLPADDIAAMSRYLMWRVDGLALHEAGPDAHDEITRAVGNDGTDGRPVTGCHRIIDRDPDKWYAGPCNQATDDVECGTDLYATSSKGNVTCRTCDATYDVAVRRAWLLGAAEDRLADATELARAVSWLGSKPLTRDRVYQWAKRERLTAKAHIEGRPLYRIGDAIDLLAKEAS